MYKCTEDESLWAYFHLEYQHVIGPNFCKQLCWKYEVLTIFDVQVGNTGDEEAWKVLYEKENDPEAQVLEVPNLTPFMHYRSVETQKLFFISPVLLPSVVFFVSLTTGFLMNCTPSVFFLHSAICVRPYGC